MSSSSEIFAAMGEAVEGSRGKTLQKKFKGSVVFIMKETGEKWSLDLKSDSTSVKKGDSDMSKPDLTVTVSEEDMIQMVNNKLNPQQAFMKGKLKIKGKMNLAMKLTVIITATRKVIKAGSTSKL
mmetsp:Transcript_35250/g.51791  ORF Transcript_35250/g.51791 Transcript_35250/m.51791 type:complete len:125 (-) Transcript_35250:56-430(-)